MQAAEERNFKEPRSWLGMGVKWFHGGDKNSRPLTGIVTAINQNSLEISVMPPRGGIRFRMNVKHITNPFVTNRQELTRDAGAWDYTEESTWMAEKLAPPPVPDDIAKLIIDMKEKGLNAQEIADELGDGLTHQRVNSIYRKHAKNNTATVS